MWGTQGTKRNRTRGGTWQQIALLLAVLLGSLIAFRKLSHYWRTQGKILGSKGTTLTAVELHRFQAAVKVLDPELMRSSPDQYDSAYKNPCWQQDGELKCLPHFYVSGFHTGAGALARRLAKHPNVAMDASELSYWGPTWGFWSEYRNELGGYVSGIASKAGQKLRADPAHTLVMDGSMSTLAVYWAGSGKAHRGFSTAAVACWKGCDTENGGSSGPGYERCMEERCIPAGQRADHENAVKAGVHYSDLHMPMLMRAVYGARTPKFVFLLRNPVDRIFSAFFGLKSMWERYGNSSQGFQKFVAEQVGALRACASNHTEVACALYFESLSMREEKVFFHCDQLFRGMYAVYLNIWFRYFPREQFLIINSQDYFDSPRNTTRRVLNFLGLPDPPDEATWAAMEAAGPRQSGLAGREMVHGARRILSKLYRKHNEELAKLLGDERYLQWNSMA